MTPSPRPTIAATQPVDTTSPSSVAASRTTTTRRPVRLGRPGRPGRLTAWLSRVLHRRITPSFAAHEAAGESFAYLGELARATPGGFLRFLFFMPVAGHQRQASPEQLAVARLAATAMEDCGPCLQTSARMAREAGVDPSLLRAVIQGRGAELPRDLALVERFARAVAGGWDDGASLAEEVRQTLGDGVRAELALAIATVRVFPTIKRGLGQARSCSIHPVEV